MGIIQNLLNSITGNNETQQKLEEQNQVNTLLIDLVYSENIGSIPDQDLNDNTKLTQMVYTFKKHIDQLQNENQQLKEYIKGGVNDGSTRSTK